MRILLVSEEITFSPSEGLLVFIMHLCRYLDERSEVTLLHKSGSPPPLFDSYRLLKGRLHLGFGISKFYKENDFDLVIYLPSSGLTGMGMLRAGIIRGLSAAPLILIGLQERKTGVLHRAMSLINPPDMILSPVDRMRTDLEKAGFSTGYIMPGYDENSFRPVTKEEKKRLRKKYGFPEEKFLVLHVGHIKESRNLATFLRYRDWGKDILPVIKGGEIEPSWRDRLRLAGIIVIDEYTDDIHELYQACDLYLFPVSSSLGALEFPLSVIEAAACDLPVLTTRFGALPEMLEEGGDFIYYAEPSEIAGKISRLRGIDAATSRIVESFSWNNVLDRYLKPHIELLSPCSKRKIKR
ncbi:MAG: glycosyltransferase family 4 protein [Candidatus Krumholzibacteriota bacterium]|nr:glycosyltransferase family 4 protein [Candidatus Krumholzibacteriota bacterium]